jgi:cell wall-associated NlpC family hydrolase
MNALDLQIQTARTLVEIVSMVDHKRYLPQKLTGCRALIATGLLYLLLTIGCGGDTTVSREPSIIPPPKPLPPMGHTIQVGAFSNIDNAVRLTARLQARRLNAYHFRHESGLYKVRFGNYVSKEAARSKAEKLMAEGIIAEYYIVGPAEYTTTAHGPDDNEYIRDKIVDTANRYIGIPYRWGGESRQTGFDCSGLTMVIYRLNGLKLPRSSRMQWQTGRSIGRNELSKGDLVFFATSGGKRVTHVGIYTGNNKFLHAPGRGRKIRISSMSNDYFKSRYLGARSYL